MTHPRFKSRRQAPFAALLGILFALSAFGQSAWRDTVEQFEVQMRTLNPEQALKTAQEALESARSARPRRTHEVVEALTMIGRAYVALENPAAAENHFVEAVQLVETRLGAFDRRLIEPLTQLGRLYASTHHHEQAVATLERALILSRRNVGLYDLSQAAILQQLAESYTQLGAFADAKRHLDYLRNIAERAYGERDPRLTPTLCDIADWYSRVGAGETARMLYRQAIDIVSEKRGKASVELVAPLLGLARTYTRELSQPRQDARERSLANFPPTSGTYDESLDGRFLGPRYLNPEGETALLRAVQVLERQPDVPSSALRNALIVLGDWYQIKQDERKALDAYKRAYKLAAAEDAQLESSDLFDTPVPLYYPVPYSAVRHAKRPPEEVEEHYVLVEFTVTEQGAVDDAKVVETDASKRHVSDTLSAIERARFRPRFVNGEPAATTGMRHRQVFRIPKKSARLERSAPTTPLRAA
jgi:tetratricopeptide (TPR) repeat protein